MKPIIGIILRPMKTETGREVDAIYYSNKKAILQFGGLPLGIPLYHKEIPTKEEIEQLEYLLSKCDGILLQGGDDFYPLDICVARYTRKNKIPTLGICLGMQLMCCAARGIMEDFKDPSFHKQKDVNYVHPVQIASTSKLHQIVKEETILVNSRHQSYIEDTSLTKVGFAPDGTLEAVEDSSHPFFIGVQWHPEDMITYDTVESHLWEAFIQACKE